MKEDNINALYFSLVTHFLDSLEGGVTRNHKIKQVACSDKTPTSILEKSFPNTPRLDKTATSFLEKSYPDKKSLENIKNPHAKSPLHITTDTNIIIGEGVENPVILIVGEDLICHENIKDITNVSKNIEYLDKWLNSINLNRKKTCYIANIVKCNPQNNNLPNYEEIQECLHCLHHYINIRNPSIILACGRIAGQILCQRQTALIALRQEVHDYNNFPLIVTYHPSAVLRNLDLKRFVWEDLKLLKNQLIQMGIEFNS